MGIGKPGVVVITDNAGTWTAGSAAVTVESHLGSNTWTQAFSADKDTSMTALAAQIAIDQSVASAVYNAGAHTITITPRVGCAIDVTSNLSGITGTMTFSIATTIAEPKWASDLSSAANTEPSGAKKDLGFVFSEKPPANWFNWLFNNLWLWVRWMNDRLSYVLQHVWEKSSGSFTATMNGTGSPTGTVTWEKKGNLVILHIPQIANIDVSGLGYLTMNGIPQEVRPASGKTYGTGIVVFDSAGTPTFWDCTWYMEAGGGGTAFMTISQGNDICMEDPTEISWNAGVTFPITIKACHLIYAIN